MSRFIRFLHFKTSKKPLVLVQCKKYYCSSPKSLEKIRNIGILAHIDAGKTTTTERMLYYSGVIKHMGEVHHGNTVTDYMDQERERGITITSAAVSFDWKNHQFNLIDTPGHIDFTIEVERTLNVLDGAVVILDASAGVEAQTLTVWKQADLYKIPRIIYLNKMDRSDADEMKCCQAIKKRLDCDYLLLQMPVRDDGRLTGLVDLLTLDLVDFGSKDGKTITRTELSESNHPKLFHEAKEAKFNLIDKLSEFSDALADVILSCNNLDDVKLNEIVRALREVTINQKAVPIVLGSSYKNVGVQTLMDAIVLFLPSPKDLKTNYNIFGENLCAKAFKIIHDKQKGPLVFLRLYNGSLKKNQKVYCIQRDVSEQVGRVLLATADDFDEVPEITNGNIAVVTHLKECCSGDLLTNSSSASLKAQKRVLQSENPELLERILNLSGRIPQPVFFCSVEPPSQAFQAQLDQALEELKREDPSLSVVHNEETGQTVLGGMGELHLDIIKTRLQNDYKIDVDLGPLQIAYQETPVEKCTQEIVYDNKIGSSKQFVSIKLSLLPQSDKQLGKDILLLDKSPEAASATANLSPRHLQAIKQGLEVAFLHGPKISSPIINCNVMLHHLEVGRGTSNTVVSATTTKLLQKMLNASETNVLEPIMSLEIIVPEEHFTGILTDLSRRRSDISEVSMKGNNKLIVVEVPLSELMGYSTDLRTISSGTASFTMEFSEYRKMSSYEEEKAIKNVRGF